MGPSRRGGFDLDRHLHRRCATRRAVRLLLAHARRLLDAFVREAPTTASAVDGGEAPAAALKRLKADRAFMRKLREAKSRLEAGFVAIDPTSGEVKAWVGSRDFQRDQFDHVAQAARQPGSTFKPIVYGAALEKGIPPEQPTSTRSWTSRPATAPSGARPT
jgi:cell division protein FtsI/penicillin-binding protein 2